MANEKIPFKSRGVIWRGRGAEGEKGSASLVCFVHRAETQGPTLLMDWRGGCNFPPEHLCEGRCGCVTAEVQGYLLRTLRGHKDRTSPFTT